MDNLKPEKLNYLKYLLNYLNDDCTKSNRRNIGNSNFLKQLIAKQKKSKFRDPSSSHC